MGFCLLSTFPLLSYYVCEVFDDDLVHGLRESFNLVCMYFEVL